MVSGQESPEFILASASPRREELLAWSGLTFRVMPSAFEESGVQTDEEDVGLAAQKLALAKAQTVAAAIEAGIVIGADTIVVLGNERLGKPRDNAEALSMLRRLRGAAHKVVTGVAVIIADSGEKLTSAAETEVRMRKYSESEMAEYVASGSPMDKAGAYGIQDQAFRAVAAIEGCYCNVVGLPLVELRSVLSRLRMGVPAGVLDRLPGECSACRYWGSRLAKRVPAL